MSFDAEDPKWTAYVLGELDDDARAQIDGELAQSPDAQRFVDELRRTIDLLSTELHAEPCPSMAVGESVAVDPAAGEPVAGSDELIPIGGDDSAAGDIEAEGSAKLFRPIRPEGHSRFAVRRAILALAASLVAAACMISYLLSPDAWHIRDLKLVSNHNHRANEISRQSAPDGEPLDPTSPLVPQSEPATDLAYLETQAEGLPEVELQLEKGQKSNEYKITQPEYETKSKSTGGESESEGRGSNRIKSLPMFSQIGQVETFHIQSGDGEKGKADSDVGREQRRATPGERRPISEALGKNERERELGERSGDRPKGVVDSLGQVESSRLPADQPIVYPDKEVWDELSMRRKKWRDFQQQESEKSADTSNLETGVQLAKLLPQAPIAERAGDDVKVRYARAAANMARAEYEKALEANRKVKAAVPEVEINRLKLTWHKSKLEVAQAEVEFAEARRAAGVDRDRPLDDHAAEAYEPVTDNPFLPVAENPLSTFSIDVDTASYSIVRRYLQQNHQLPPRSAVRIEELVNYFHYDYPQPEGDKPFAANVEVAGCPWNAEHRLVRIGIKGREVARDHRPLTNLVFLIDVSGSMQSPDKLPLVKESLRLLTEQMGENDRVAIVVYAGSTGLALASTSGSDKQTILKALDALAAGGSTNGGQGIQLAYDIAVANFVKGGVNRVILATDGDFNVGVTDRGELVKLIEQKAASGVFLTALGYGMGNLKDATLEQLADKGNGNYAYIDNIREAKKVLVEQMSGTLVTIAKDVKIQIEFNPTQVAAFRLIGYENRILRHEDFNNDKKDAGEIGAGHTVTALYELVPRGQEPAAAPAEAPATVDPLKYQQKLAPTDAAQTAELLTLKLRYKQPDGDKSQLLEYPVKDSAIAYARATGDFKFAASVALFGMLLRDSPYKGTASFAAAHELAQEGRGSDEAGYRGEFIELIQAARELRRD